MAKYYKFRENLQFTMKEILYGEVFLAKTEELNDPLDSRIVYTFQNDEILLKNFINVLFNFIHFSRFDTDDIATNIYLYFERKNQRKFDYLDLVDFFKSDTFESIVMYYYSIKDKILFNNIVETILSNLNGIMGNNTYISSFTINPNETLMWSHYGNQHKGICLEFSSDYNRLYGNPQWPDMQKIVKPENSQEENRPAIMKFHKVEYGDTPPTINGYKAFHSIVDRSVYENDLFKDYAVNKYSKWSYEDEYRLIDASQCFAQTNINKSAVNRIFYYDQTQLTGLIFGLRVSETDKNEIVSTIIEMRTKLFEFTHILPIFIFYQARLENDNYLINTDYIIKILDFENNEISVEELNKSKENYYSILKELADKYPSKDYAIYKECRISQNSEYLEFLNSQNLIE